MFRVPVKRPLTFSLRRVLSLSSLIVLCTVFAIGQSKVDLNVKVQPASDTARGGESFSYTVTVSNVGTARGTDVILIGEPYSSNRIMTMVSGLPSAGNCELDEKQYPFVLRCFLGDIEQGEDITVLVQAKMDEFDAPGGTFEDVFQQNTDRHAKSGAINQALINLAEAAGVKDRLMKESADIRSPIGELRVSSEQGDLIEENNQATVFANLLPSRNVKPKIEILFPKADSVFTAFIGQKIAIPISVKAFDTDGTVRKVAVDFSFTPPFRYLEDDGTFKYLIGDKKYSLEEATRIQREAWEKAIEMEKAGTLKFPENLADLVAKDIYAYVVKNFGYGENTAHICATDDGGRMECTSVTYKVKSGSEIEIKSPVDKVIRTNSTVIFETVSKIRPGINAKVVLYGLNGETSYQDNSPLMTLASRVGATATHKFKWRPIAEGRYHLRARLYENGEDTETEAAVSVVVAKPRVIKITSLRNGEECTLAKECMIEVYARDNEGSPINDELEILVDGKRLRTIYSSDCQLCVPKSVRFLFPYTEKGAHTVQIVAKQQDTETELGRSEQYTIILK